MDAGPIWASQNLPGRPGRAEQERALQRAGDRHRDGLDPRGGGQGGRPGIRARTAGLHPARRPRTSTAAGPPSTDRSFSWSEPTEHILRRIRAADGAPGVPTRLCGLPVAVFDAHRGRVDPRVPAEPGTVLARRHGAVLVRTGDGAIWIGHLRSRADPQRPGHKLPATTVLADHLADVPEADDPAGYREISYRRAGPLGV